MISLHEFGKVTESAETERRVKDFIPMQKKCTKKRLMCLDIQNKVVEETKLQIIQPKSCKASEIKEKF